MLNKIKIFIAVAVLSGTVSANVQAATVPVQDGDTLWDLSRIRNTSIENIQEFNHLNTDLIHPGDVLKITPEKHYTVKQGDTLWDIAIEHHVSVSLIKEWNNLISDIIHPGLNLLIFDGFNNTNNVITEKTMKAAAPTTSKPRPTPEKAEAAPKPETKVKKESTPKVKAASTSNTNQRAINVKATAYTASCKGCSGTTATGINLKANSKAKVIAVDPSVIPLGSKVYVEGFGEAIAADTGGAIKGNRIDVFIPSEQKAINFGVKQLKVKILN